MGRCLIFLDSNVLFLERVEGPTYFVYNSIRYVVCTSHPVYTLCTYTLCTPCVWFRTYFQDTFTTERARGTPPYYY